VPEGQREHFDVPALIVILVGSTLAVGITAY
jgi:hypothetical protein